MSMRTLYYTGVIIAIIALVGGCFSWAAKDAHRMEMEKQKNKAFCAKVYNSQYDEVPLSDINWCEWWYQDDGYYVSPPPCTHSLAELKRMESWPIVCHDVAEEVGIDPPKEDKDPKVNIEKNNKVVVE